MNRKDQKSEAQIYKPVIGNRPVEERQISDSMVTLESLNYRDTRYRHIQASRDD